MLDNPLLTHEIGSLAKPSWRTKAFRGIPLNQKDLDEFKYWSEFLSLRESVENVREILQKRVNFNEEEKKLILETSSLFAIKLIEKAGVDLIYDGEQHRTEMYEFPIKLTNGFHFLGYVRSFDNKYFNKAVLVDYPTPKKFFYEEELKNIKKYAKKPIKVPITGPYTLMDWSFDEYFLRDLKIGEENYREKIREAREKFLEALAKEIIVFNIGKLLEEGIKFIQIDEPAATTKKDEIEIFFNALRETLSWFKGKAVFSLHICFSDYELLFPHMNKVEGLIKEFHFEYANRDSKELGVSDEARTGYKLLEFFKDLPFVVGLGVIDVHTDNIEPKELIRDRVLFAYEKIKNPLRIWVAPDCGLRTRTWHVAYEKLCHLVEGVELAKVSIGL